MQVGGLGSNLFPVFSLGQTRVPYELKLVVLQSTNRVHLIKQKQSANSSAAPPPRPAWSYAAQLGGHRFIGCGLKEEELPQQTGM